MTLTAKGLPNGGVTTFYKFQYESSLGGAGGIEPARTTTAMNSVDADFNLMQSWFPGVTFPFSTPIEVQVVQGGGTAGWLPLKLESSSNDANYLRMLLVAEITEMFMKSQAKGWYPGNEGSLGEGLSRFFAEQFLIESGAGLSEFPNWGWTANQWLTPGTWVDWVNNIDPTGDEDTPAIGCSILFIYWLFTQLDFTFEQITGAAASNLAGVYTHLTGDAGNPFPFFVTLLKASPGTVGITAGPNLDDPWPVALSSVWVEKSTFGVDEVKDVIAANAGTFDAAFWIVVEGFSKAAFQALGVTVSLSGSLTTTNGIKVAPSASASIDYEDPAKPNAPQRIRIPYDITFTTDATPPFPTVESSELDLDVELLAGGQPVPASQSAASFELVAGADPYFTNVNTSQGNVFYLSQDLRVFTATPGQPGQSVPVAGGPTFANDSVAGAFTYIQELLVHLNGNGNFTSGTQDPFSTVLPHQAGALQTDSSVTPYTLYFTDPFDPKLYNNYQFAIARVRLRGPAGSAGEAQGVKVFFRLWCTQTVDTDYQPSTTYTSTPDGAGFPGVPTVGTGEATIPFFATGNVGSNTDYVAGGVNNQDIEITSGDTAWWYFGCFLNLYDSENVVNGKQVQAWLPGTHHCLVAQIAYDDAPIPTSAQVTPSPENSDKLAQRNLQVTSSDNPGGSESHRLPQTFDVRPTPPASVGQRPDELMIDWGDLPVGAVASIYWPQASAADVLALADEWYSFHALRAADTNTIRCAVTNGVTYVPIPPGTEDSYAGLLTIDLPTTVVAGQEFDVVVRRVATTVLREASDVKLPQATFGGPSKARSAQSKASAATVVEPPRTWRFVTGSFQVRIPVSHGHSLLFAEETTLAIMRWRQAAMAPSNRWYPVLERYIGYIEGRVRGFGGDPAVIPPSLGGAPLPRPKGQEPCRDGAVVVGHVTEISYDCFGDFDGFRIVDCCCEHVFESREPGIGDVVLTALRHRLRVAVSVAEPSRRIQRVLIV